MKNNSTRFPITLVKIGWRYLMRHSMQTILMVIGIAMGVAVVIGIDMANQSASRAFDLSTTAITGQATHFISGGSKGIDEQVYIDLRWSGLEVPSTPVLTAYVSSPQFGGETLQIFGVDPFTEGPFRNYFNQDGEIPVAELTTFLTQPGSVLLSTELADRFNLGLNSEFTIVYAGQNKRANIAGLLQPADSLSQLALSGILLMDISTAQELTGNVGKLERVDLIINEDSEGVLANLEEFFPAGVRILPVEARHGTVEEMTNAFRVNLTALSLLAMVVALFLIYNTMTFSVLRRRPLFGTLRCLGVTRREVFLMVVSEALLIGIIGAGFGILIGILMGRGAVQLVTQTINDLFFVVTVRDIPIPTSSLIKGVILGTGATVVTAAFPAWEAASVPPRTAITRSGLEAKAQGALRGITIAGFLIILLGLGILSIPTRELWISFLGTFSVVIGLAMLTPKVTVWIMTGANYLTSRLWGALGRLAPREVVNAISRTSIAVAALMIALAVTIGVSLMVNSFRTTVDTWMNQILHGDIYISVPGATVSQPSRPINPEVIEIIQSWPGVARVDLLQTAIVDSPHGPIQISANNNPNDGEEQIFVAADYPPDAIWESVQAGSILVSEPLTNRLDLPRHGGELALYTDAGMKSFPIAGVYYDYASSQGNAIFSLDVYRKNWGEDQIAAAALVLESGVDVQTLTNELKSVLAPTQNLLIRPNQALRSDTLEIFDRTFAITGALQLMTTLVAFVGILSAMMSLQLEKQRQLGIMKSIGLTARQLWGLVALETGLMGAVAGLFAMPTGYILALILVYIINRRSFGWTLQMDLTSGPFIGALIISILAALLAGLYPARRIVQRNIADSIRFD
jgi:putative ABC transport system permease protein